MAEHAATPLQLSLFPDAFEVQAAALAALHDLDMARARKLLDRVRTQNPRLVNLGLIDAGLRLLESVTTAGRPGLEFLGRAVWTTHDEWLAGRLPAASAGFVDEIVARHWRKLASAATFLDDEQRVHRGLLHLVLGDPAAARQHLGASLAGDFGHRADLWGYMGDAAFLLERAPEANACYVRALLLSAADIDLLRIRLRPLAALHEELRREHPEPRARELLLIHAWLQRVLDIEPANGWFDGQLSRLEATCADRRDRRFAWLLYLDRSQPDGRVDLARREEMAELEPELFGRFMRACRERERPAG